MKGNRKSRFHIRRGALRERVKKWEVFETGSTNRLWRGRGDSGWWLLKWYRYPQSGIHPEVEVAEHLGGYASAPVPAYGGCLEETLDSGERMTVGMVQRWVEGRSAWDWLLELFLEGEVPSREVESWGIEIGRLHRLLALGSVGSAFVKAPWRMEDAVALEKRVLAVGEAFESAVSDERGFEKEGCRNLCGEIRSLWVGQASVWRERVAALSRLRFDGWRSRIHGDLHLGQLLRGECGQVVVVDFEGEPLRPLEERRRLDLPLRDVAGMWRSFAYAGAVGGAEDGVVGCLQEAFLKGWLSELDPPDGDWRGLLSGLVWEKAIYEALYEIRHRPDWLWVPWSELAKTFTQKPLLPEP